MVSLFKSFCRKVHRRCILLCKKLIPLPNPPSHLLLVLPDEILELIFQNLCFGDRSRCRLVCKTWNLLLTPGKIPLAPEVPWQILTPKKDSRNKTKEKIRLRSLLERRTYRFKFPTLHGLRARGWCGGSSRGWLLLDVSSNMMALWNPISGSVHHLPPLGQYCLDNIHRVEVFSTDSVECIVAVAVSGTIAMCTPRETQWTMLSRMFPFNHDCHDILFRTGDGAALHALCTYKSESNRENYLRETIEIHLKDCSVKVHPILVRISSRDLTLRVINLIGGIQTRHMQLAEASSITGEVLIVVPVLKCLVTRNGQLRHKTTRFQVFGLPDTNGKLKVMRSIGKQAIFLGTTGSYLVRGVEGVVADCIYFVVHSEVFQPQYSVIFSYTYYYC